MIENLDRFDNKQIQGLIELQEQKLLKSTKNYKKVKIITSISSVFAFGGAGLALLSTNPILKCIGLGFNLAGVVTSLIMMERLANLRDKRFDNELDLSTLKNELRCRKEISEILTEMGI